ncbi:MAG: hypothetical protein JJE40_17780 [Vicinamibacteria bacterium]|nr:hypothetical protein [Vicinamibacteria bacterium]
MTEDQHASVPGAAGSVSVNPRATIHLTPAQYYVRLAVALLAGAAIVGGAAYALGLFSSEEPPIRVRPGSIELQLPTGKKWQDKNGYWQIKDGEKAATYYEILISTSAPSEGCKLEANTSAIKVIDSGNNWFLIEIAGKRTKVTASDPTKVKMLSGERTLSFDTGDYIAEIQDSAGNDICKFGSAEFIGATIY